MAENGTTIAISNKVLEVLNSPVLQGMLEYKSELEKLSKTASTIKDVLLDADERVQLTHEEQGWIARLKDVLYNADDLFDEFHTIVQRNKLNQDKFSEKVRDFFSTRNPVFVAHSMSKVIKNVGKKLDDIANDHARFGSFKGNSEATRKRR